MRKAQHRASSRTHWERPQPEKEQPAIWKVVATPESGDPIVVEDLTYRDAMFNLMLRIGAVIAQNLTVSVLVFRAGILRLSLTSIPESDLPGAPE